MAPVLSGPSDVPGQLPLLDLATAGDSPAERGISMPKTLSPPSETGPIALSPLVLMLALDEIEIGPNRRPVDWAKVEELAKSIDDVGLIHHPVVLPAGCAKPASSKYRLVVGRHRVEAFRLLGRTHIAVVVREMEALKAELAELDENLHRNELTYMDRATQLKRRKEIYEELYPQSSAGAAQAAGMNRKQGREVEDPAPTFAKDTAAKTGMSERVIRQDVQIARALSAAVQERIRGTALADSKSDLIELAKLTPERQMALVEAVLNGTAQSIYQARKVEVRELAVTLLVGGKTKQAALDEALMAFPGLDGWSVWNMVEPEVVKEKGGYRRVTPEDAKLKQEAIQREQREKKAQEETRTAGIRLAVAAFPADPFRWEVLRRALIAGLHASSGGGLNVYYDVLPILDQHFDLPERWSTRELEGLIQADAIRQRWGKDSSSSWTVNEKILAALLPDESIADQKAALALLRATSVARRDKMPLRPAPESILELHDMGYGVEQIQTISDVPPDRIWEMLEQAGKVERTSPEDEAELADQMDLVDAELLASGELEEREAPATPTSPARTSCKPTTTPEELLSAAAFDLARQARQLAEKAHETAMEAMEAIDNLDSELYTKTSVLAAWMALFMGDIDECKFQAENALQEDANLERQQQLNSLVEALTQYPDLVLLAPSQPVVN